MAFAHAGCVGEHPARPEPVALVRADTLHGDTLVRDTVISWPEQPHQAIEVMRHSQSVSLDLEDAVPRISRGTGAEVVQTIYTAEIGVREATGRNDGARVEEYLAACGRRKGDAWCAAFVTWTFRQAGVDAVVSGWSPDWFRTNTIYTRGGAQLHVPDRADVFGIYFSELKRIAHVGFVDEWREGNFCITVEGNTNDTGSREGDGVYRKRRLKSQVYKVSRYIDLN